MNNIVQIIISILFTLALYVLFYYIYKKKPLSFIYPNIMTMAAIIILLLIFNIPYELYEGGGKVISSFLGPTVVILAVPLYETLNILFKNLRVILIGSFLSVFLAFSTTFLLCKAFVIPKDIFVSLIPRSITTPMAIEAAGILGAIPSITVTSVIITGITGAILGSLLSRVFKITNFFALGSAFGTSSHVIGTTQALEKGQLIGSVSAICIPITGILTILCLPLFNWIITNYY
ncbi:hypothetical protein AZF37_04905 [endosymbiont 'TC1' of Trimyema compressum]|uniref:LrgB family protein n=1 Tax=endosymbiont 'TC1' of Trimyema compressum TaxID=243899 RepID=UPI0007F0B602|nr:LrgB family protein [endosymbiont 'TC1' of Trimyema compressum]AMP20598.1 hypothetical protein AZF37_04905 [endosymbiont 'TC1' of Trimyema compressum]